jgi:hypothetical protein
VSALPPLTLDIGQIEGGDIDTDNPYQQCNRLDTSDCSRNCRIVSCHRWYQITSLSPAILTKQQEQKKTILYAIIDCSSSFCLMQSSAL